MEGCGGNIFCISYKGCTIVYSPTLFSFKGIVLMSLKNLTGSKHANAERSWFAGLMMSGEITNEQYSVYLKQQYECYNALETRFNNMDDSGFVLPSELKRAENIMEDLKELNSDIENIPVFNSTKIYINYILSKCETNLLYAHVYVRYLGDLKGGQMIASKIPGEGKYYQFDNPDELEKFIRSNLREDNNFVDECNKCFDSAITLFKDLKSHFS